MRKILCANFFRLRKDKFFWSAFWSLLVLPVLLCFISYQSNLRQDHDPIYVENALFNLFPVIAFVCAVFAALYLGTEFDENTIRNKLIVGHTRKEIYYANYLTCVASSLALLLICLISSGTAGYIFFRDFLMSRTRIAFLIFCCILCTMVFSAISVCLAMNIHRKSTAIVAVLLVMFAIMIFASCLEGVLEEPEITYSSVTVTMEGVELGEPVPNPAYAGGPLRTVMEFVFDMLPSGQAIQINNMNFDRCPRWPLLSVIMLAIITAAGYLPFRRSDLQ